MSELKVVDWIWKPWKWLSSFVPTINRKNSVIGKIQWMIWQAENFVPEIDSPNLIKVTSFTYSPFWYDGGVGGGICGNQHYVSCVSDIMSWICSEMINMIMTNFGQSDFSIFAIAIFIWWYIKSLTCNPSRGAGERSDFNKIHILKRCNKYHIKLYMR